MTRRAGVTLGAQVLITRPAAEAAATAVRLRAMGWEPVIAPLLEVHPIRLRAPGAPHAVLVASGNAIPAVTGIDAPVLAVGDATADRARAAGFGAVTSAGGDAADLVALARRTLPAGATLLLACGRGQGVALAADLRDAGFVVRRRVAYEARPVRRLPDAAREALLEGRVRAVLFLSAATARTFVRVLPAALRPALREIDALAIGAPAAEALAPLPWRQVRVSIGPTLEQVLALL